MNTVSALNVNDIRKIAKLLKSNSDRDYVLFACGLYLGRRITDIISLRVRNVKDKDFIYFKEKKTGKHSVCKVNDELKSILKEYCNGKDDDEYLFRPLKRKENIHISRVTAWRILNSAAKEVGINAPIGCHSMRKSLGASLFKAGYPIEMIMLLLNQSDPAITKRYIGVEQEEINKLYDKLDFKLLSK